MRYQTPEIPRSITRLRFIVVMIGICVAAVPLLNRSLKGQEPIPPNPASNVITDPAVPPIPELRPQAGNSKLPSIWDLTIQGGVFMIPIGICSIVVVAFAIERLLGLRRSRIIPKPLVTSLETWGYGTAGIDPRHAYELCQMHPSSLSNVVCSAIMKIGRPHAEIEKAVEDAVSREAEEMSHNIRPINVSISIAPLLGLLGTVQGMIIAFMVTSTTSATGAAKGQELAQGIYVALVTTFAGLCVAIPGTVFASALEGRIDRLLREIEDILNEVLPQFEKHEGKLRVVRNRDIDGDSLSLIKSVPLKPPTEASRVSDPASGKATIAAPKKPGSGIGSRVAPSLTRPSSSAEASPPPSQSSAGRSE